MSLQAISGISFSQWNDTSPTNPYTITVRTTVADSIGNGLTYKSVAVIGLSAVSVSRRYLQLQPHSPRQLHSQAQAQADHSLVDLRMAETDFHATAASSGVSVTYAVNANAGSYSSPAAAYSAYSSALSSSIKTNAFNVLLNSNAVAQGAPGLAKATGQAVAIVNLYTSTPTRSPTSTLSPTVQQSRHPTAHRKGGPNYFRVEIAAVCLGGITVLVLMWYAVCRCLGWEPWGWCRRSDSAATSRKRVQKTPIRYRKRRRDPVTGEFTDEPPDSGGILEFFNFSGTYEEEREVGSTWWSRATNWTGRAPEQTHNSYRRDDGMCENGYPADNKDGVEAAWMMSSPFRALGSAGDGNGVSSLGRRRVGESKNSKETSKRNTAEMLSDDETFGLQLDDFDFSTPSPRRNVSTPAKRQPFTGRTKSTGSPQDRNRQSPAGISTGSKTKRTPSPAARSVDRRERYIDDDMGRL